MKVSGIGVPGRPWTAELQRPVVDSLIDAFGTGRCLFASNYPVDGLCASLDLIFESFKVLTRRFAPPQRLALFADNAVRLYRLHGLDLSPKQTRRRPLHDEDHPRHPGAAVGYRGQCAGNQGPPWHQPARDPSADHRRTQFAELAEKKSNGRIRISVFPGAVLGSDQQMQAALRGGTQEFTVPSTATLANLVKEFGVVGLPFSFASEKQADAVLDGSFGQSLLARLPEKDLVGLAFWENGFRNITNSRRPIVKAEDIAGIKVRTMQNNLYIDLFNGLGANAVPMAVNELFPALESRAVDGQENPYTVVHAQKFYDVQKYLSTTGHAYDALVLIASKKFWDGLSPADARDAAVGCG